MIGRLTASTLAEKGRKVTTSASAPSSAANGDIWYKTDNGSMSIYYNSSWIEVGSDPVRIPLSGAGGGFVTGSLVHTTPSGYTDTVYLYGTGTGNTLFTTNGVETFDPNADSNVIETAVQSDGKILIGGQFTTVGGVTRNRLARLHPNGDLDTTFADPNVNSTVYAIVEQSDGKILIGGAFTAVGGVTRFRVARVHANGDLDTTFDPVASSVVLSLALQSDGKIVIGGSFNMKLVGGVTRNRIARVHANGALDTTFDPNLSNSANCLEIQSDGKIFIGGNFTTVGAVTRTRLALLHANGALDTSFADPNVSSVVRALTTQSDGKIVIGGNFTTVGGTTSNYIARVYANGALDTTFDPNANNIVYDIKAQSDGKIVIGGSFTAVGGVTRNSVARVHPNGAVDTTFDPNANSTVEGLAIQSDGKILIGGSFTTVNGVTRNRIARVEPYTGSFYDSQSAVYVTPSANSMNILISDYPIPSGHSMVSLLNGTLSGYVIREAN